MVKRIILICGLMLGLTSAARAQITNSLPPLNYNGPVAVNGNRGTGLDSIKNVNINGTFNIKTYGASGSRVTMTCTSTASSSNLTSCGTCLDQNGNSTTCDFKSGQFVRVAAAGIDTSGNGMTAESAPSAPTVACAVNTGAGSNCSAYTLTSAGTCSSTTNSTILTLSNAAGATVEDGQLIAVCGAGSGTNATCADGATDLVTNVVGRVVGGNTIVLAAPCTTTVTNNNVILGQAASGYTYGYKISAIFGGPNGAETAASSATTVSQTAQAPFNVTSSTWPGTHTNVSWSAVTGATAYNVYRSVNNGASYNYYTTTPGTANCTGLSAPCINDYGTQASYGFGSSDYGFPATAPASPVPNDVFAQITSVSANGATVALGTWPTTVLPNGPKYLTAPTGAAGTYPSQPSQSATVTVYHDDTEPFQALYQTLLNQNGNALVKIPVGDYNVSMADVYQGPRAFNYMGLSNVVLEGDGWGSRIHAFGTKDGDAFGPAFIWSFCGFAGRYPAGVHSQQRCAEGFDNTGTNTAYSLVDPVIYGSNIVTLATPANASNFSVGQYTIVWSGDGTYPANTYQTLLDKVTAINSTTGQITLADPVVHYYSATLIAPWSSCTHCAGTPKITPLPFGPVADGITLRNFWYEGAPNLIKDDSTANVTLSGLYVHSHGLSGSNLRYNWHITGNTIIEDGVPSSQPTGFSASYSTRNLLVENNNYTGRGAVAWQACIENSGNNVLLKHNILNMVNAFFDSNNFMFGGQGCDGELITDNEITINRSNMATLVGWASPGPWDLKMSNNKIHIDRQALSQVGLVVPIQNNTITDYTRVCISDNHWIVDNDNSNGPRTFGVSPGCTNNQWTGSSASILANLTDFIGFGQSSALTAVTSEAAAQNPYGTQCFVSSLSVKQATAANANPTVYTIDNNTSGQSVTCSTASSGCTGTTCTSTTCTDSSHFFTVNPGNLLSLKVANPVSANATGVINATFLLNCL